MTGLGQVTELLFITPAPLRPMAQSLTPVLTAVRSFNLIWVSKVIKGWDQGVATMARGETAVFTITSKYAYGEMGSAPKIPGNATLVFEVQLFDFEGEDITKDKDKGITKRIRQAGQGFDQPNDGGLATVDIIGYHNKREFDKRSDLTFVMGEGRDHNLPSGLETALEKMKRNEKAHITLNTKYNFGKLGCPAFGIKPNDQFSLTYEVYLKSFERAKEGWQMSGDEKLEQSQLYKDKGTEFFKLNKIDMAANKYRKVIDLLEHEISLKGEKEESRRTMLQAGRMNLTMCLLKSGDWIEARDLCEKVLAENENVPKAYFRRGEANIQLNDLDAAIEDFKDCLEIDPENKAAKNKIVQCKQLIKNKRDKEKKTYAKMFDRFAEADARSSQQRSLCLLDFLSCLGKTVIELFVPAMAHSCRPLWGGRTISTSPCTQLSELLKSKETVRCRIAWFNGTVGGERATLRNSF